MHKFLLSLVFYLVVGTCLALAQVGIGTENPDNSAILELQSNSQGFLMPRLTSAQRNAIQNPAQGLMIFNLDLQCLQCNVGTAQAPDWQCLTAPVAQSNAPTFALQAGFSGYKNIASSDGTGAEDTIRTYTFELEEDAVVHISYNAGITNLVRTNGSSISNGLAYLLRTYFTVDGQGFYGSHAFPYSNYVFFSGSFAIGRWDTVGSHYLDLPAGIHTIQIYGEVYGGGANSIKADFGVLSLQVLAYKK